MSETETSLLETSSASQQTSASLTPEVQMLKFVYDRQKLHEAAFVNVWYDFKSEFIVSENVMELKLKFFQLLENLSSYTNELNDYEMKYFSNGKVSVSQNILTTCDLKQDTDFVSILDPNDLKSFVLANQNSFLPVIMPKSTRTTTIREHLFKIPAPLRDYFTRVMNITPEMAGKLDDDEIRDLLKIYCQENHTLPNFKDPAVAPNDSTISSISSISSVNVSSSLLMTPASSQNSSINSQGSLKSKRLPRDRTALNRMKQRLTSSKKPRSKPVRAKKYTSSTPNKFHQYREFHLNPPRSKTTSTPRME